ncbi:thiosulfate sulfurtransferase/rhodanese-like domain-containing protein 3 [Antedon mediterranea]|uniref:thiosulfate sulfurtransferase/rhodanese-like domain-containing protein 3 n=1 Tax=Antedon mediterranea TaxID=105859 RepID=UPI003AF91C1E
MTTCEKEQQNSGIIRYDELRKLVNEDRVHLIDVRSNEEVKNSGKIGKATVIPVATINDALQLPEKEFTHRYGITKPSFDDDRLVFSCTAGVRCKTAWETARELGFTKSRYYEGSWREWAAKENLN